VWAGPPGWGFSAGLKTLPCKKTKEPNNNKPRTYRFNGKTNGHRKQDLLFGTWNVRTMFQSGTDISVVKEIEKYKIKIVEHKKSDGVTKEP